MKLVDSGASYCFIAEHVAHTAGVCWDIGVRRGVQLADGELWPCLRLAHVVHMQFLPRVWQPVDCWVVPLAMDFILGQPWLRAIEPEIDWGIQHVLWEQDGDVVSMFGRRALPGTVLVAQQLPLKWRWSPPSVFATASCMGWYVLLHCGWACCHRQRARARQ